MDLKIIARVQKYDRSLDVRWRNRFANLMSISRNGSRSTSVWRTGTSSAAGQPVDGQASNGGFVPKPDVADHGISQLTRQKSGVDDLFHFHGGAGGNSTGFRDELPIARDCRDQIVPAAATPGVRIWFKEATALSATSFGAFVLFTYNSLA